VVVFAAGSGLDALCLTPERIIGRAIVTTNSATEIMGYVRRALDGETLTAIVPIRDRLFETHCAPLREAGRVIGVSGVALDITAQAHAQAELRRRDVGLTPRERDLLPLLARKELTARKIGTLLHIEPSTIRTYIEQIAEKLSVATTRKAVVLAARERGLLE
jgi:DNA-binding NarL/FixJ family response regulator